MNADFFTGWGMMICVTIIYLFPTVIAFVRKHGNLMPVFLVNLFLGWTIIGWFIAFVWSTTNNVRPRTA